MRSWIVAGLVVVGLASCSERPLLDRSVGACWTWEGFDDDCDGRATSQCRLATFDADGRPRTIQIDENCDGRQDNDSRRFEDGYGDPCQDWTYGADGRSEVQRSDRRCDGTWDTCIHRTFDERGRLLTERYDAGCDGRHQDCWTVEWGPVGDEPVRGVADTGCDGTPDLCVERRFDEAGRLLWEGWDDGCDGVFDRNCHQFAYREDGQIAVERWDLDCDGTWDRNCSQLTYDDDGRWTLKHYEFMCDGGQPECTHRVLDDAGRELSWWLDQGCDGTPDRECREFTYDSEGRIATRTESPFCDSTRECGTHTWSEDGLKWGFRRDFGCDGIEEFCTEGTVDADGNGLSYVRDDPCDGTPDWCTWTEWVAGLPVLEAFGTACERAQASCIVRDWDGFGNPLSDRYFERCDGGPATQCRIRQTNCGPGISG